LDILKVFIIGAIGGIEAIKFSHCFSFSTIMVPSNFLITVSKCHTVIGTPSNHFMRETVLEGPVQLLVVRIGAFLGY